MNGTADAVDVVVIGGGITGAATAWHLARSGVGKVAVLERNRLAGGATARAATLLSLARSKGFVIPWVRATYDMIETLAAGDGGAVGFARVGAVHAAASEAAVGEVDETARVSRSEGVAAETITGAEAKRRVPWLAAESVARAWWFPEEAFVDAYLLTARLMDEARARGYALRIGEEARRIRVERGCVTGVETDRGFLSARSVVLATGIHANLLLAEHGLALPFAPVRSRYWITGVEEDRFPARHPIVLLPDARAYARPENGGLIVGWREPEGVHTHPAAIPADTFGYRFVDDPDGWDGWEGCVASMSSFFPGLSDTGVSHYVAGFSGYAPDGLFTVGEFPEISGLVVAAGCSGMGIAVSGGLGQAAAALAVGENPPLPTEAFSPRRFGKVEVLTEAFMEHCVQARSRKKTG